MTAAGRVDQPQLGNALRDHETRIRQLEAVPAAGSAVYVQDILLAADTADIVFAAFPLDLRLLELTWLAFLTDDVESLIYLLFNGDTPGSITNDNFWNLTVTNQVGSQGSLDTSGSGEDSAGGFAYVSASKASWGSLRFPNYNADLSASPNNGPWYVGEGGWANTGAGATPDAWTVSGYRQQTGQSPAMTALQLNALELGAFTTVKTFAAGSRFTLTGY